MKTTAKTLLTNAFMIATMVIYAQNTSQKKACIKIEKDENGKVTKIDTCVTASTDAELQQKLKAIGLSDIPGAPEISIEIDSLGGDGKEVTMTKIIMIDDEGDTGNRKKGGKSSAKVVSSSGKNGSYAYVMDGKGNVVKSGDGSASVIVTDFDKPGNIDKELDKMLKEYGIDPGKEGSGKKVIIKNSDSKNGKSGNEVKVYVFSKTEIKDLSDTDKKKLPAGVSKAIEKSKPFNELSVSPNPTDDAFTVSFRSSGNDDLQIKIYDMNGKTVYTEASKNPEGKINKNISLKEFGTGTYFVHLTQGKYAEVRKVMVK